MSARRHDRCSAGFTILEVLIGTLILGIGLIGILGMQTSASVANRHSYSMRAATELASTTLERLKRDAIRWTSDPSSLSSTSWLRNGLMAGSEGNWVQPPLPIDATGGQPTYNDLALPRATGVMVPTDQESFAQRNSRFCIQYRLTWIIQNELARADVRVHWPRTRVGDRLQAGTCGTIPGLTAAQLQNEFFTVRVTGMARWNQLGAVPTTAGL